MQFFFFQKVLNWFLQFFYQGDILMKNYRREIAVSHLQKFHQNNHILASFNNSTKNNSFITSTTPFSMINF